MSLRLVERKKVCANPDCPRGTMPQPWSSFKARSRWPDGGVRNVQSRCRVCHAAKDREYRAQRPLTEQQRIADRARRREQYAKRLQDPEYVVKLRATQAAAYKGRYRADPEYARRNIEASRRYQAKVRADPAKFAAMKARAKARREAHKLEGHVRLPIGPLRDWLEREIRLLSQQDGDNRHAGASRLCTRGDLDPRRLYAWRNDNQSVPLDIVDRFACTYGEPRLVADLWPDFYESEAA